ncbi:hypothetical protein ASPZODRAFT_131484 [Penicilliopsis zonata CBS 506.65]|uniref:Uncharacterized protein n=1 Tax=Penicilliopsis zonata CBS 506.65 TaxID=1073090 RepID=A0A1L9SL00_9EURO|nr:hypothetical protein ASPZODRAFT_131484 [Penicilliopsis zonata CBS 506.65]OJJ47889.1 hypothetical protein ASPZODRAFT_131484 [Penicilliopsis zonata CBS 506.65]
MASQSEILLRAVSRLLGWIYTLCWSASFYPQPWQNIRRRSVAGQSIDLPTLNVLGFVAYTVYTTAFLWSPVVREQYAARHPQAAEPTVRFNDFAFAFHAMIMCVIIYSQFWPQIWGFKVFRFQTASKPILALFWGSLLAVAIVVGIVLQRSPDGGYDPSSWAWIDVMYAFSYVKVVATVVKYVPQAWLNYKRKSTIGWSIITILFDLSGGILSLLQLVIDSALENDWSGITGNPVKFLLGNVSIFFDIIFIVQHYILYKNASEADDKIFGRPSLITPLLSEPDELSRAAHT